MKFLSRQLWAGLIVTYFVSVLIPSLVQSEELELVRATPSAGDVAEISPLASSKWSLTIVKNDLFEMLVAFDERGEVTGAVAESWELTDDRMSWIFHLRKDAMWSDGVPVTAGDFVFAFSYWSDPERKSRVKSSRIVGAAPNDSRELGVTALDDHTLKIDMIEPQGLEVAILASPSFAPLPRHAAPEEMTNWSNWPNHPSNGSYVLEQIDRDNNQYILSANPYAREELRGTYTRVVHLLANIQEIAPLFNDGYVDVLSKVGRLQPGLFLRKGARFLPTEDSLYYYYINLNKPHLADKRVRQAITLAVDPARIVERMFTAADSVQPAYYMVRPERLDLPVPRRPDIALARQLMDEAGYSESNRLTLTLGTNDAAGNVQIAQLMKEDLEQIHIDVDLDIGEKKFSAYKKKRNAGDYDLARVSTTPSDQSIKGIYARCLRNLGINCGFFQNKEYSELLLQSGRTQDERTHFDLIRRANDILVNEYAIVPIYHSYDTMLLSEHVMVDPDKSLRPRPTGAMFRPRPVSQTSVPVAEVPSGDASTSR